MAVQGDWLYYSFGTSYVGEKSDSIYAYKKNGSSKRKLSNKYGKYINIVGDWIYFSKYGPNNGENVIYKVKVDGTEETKLNDNYICGDLTVISDKIYFTSDYNYGTLFRMNIDGSNKIILGKDSIYSAAITDNYIYYQNTAELNTLYKMNLDGSGKTKVSDEYVDNYSYIVDDEWIYYYTMDTGSYTINAFYRMHLDGSQKDLIE